MDSVSFARLMEKKDHELLALIVELLTDMKKQEHDYWETWKQAKQNS